MSTSTMRVPNSVLRSTSIGGSSFTCPMTVASSPGGWDRVASSGVSVSAPSTIATSLRRSGGSGVTEPSHDFVVGVSRYPCSVK